MNSVLCVAHMSRLLDICLPRGGYALVLLEAYFDESGDLEDTGNFCVSGYLIDSEAAKIMENKWWQVLNNHGVEYFHAKECIPEPPTGPCKGIDKQTRADMVAELIDLVKEHTMAGASFVARKEYFNPEDSDIDNLYSHYASMAVTNFQQFIATHGIEGEIAFIFEAGHAGQNKAQSKIAQILSDTGHSVVFKPKKKTALLHAADLLAWQTRKYEQDYFTQERTPRKDFLSLMKHEHMFYYMGVDGQDKSFSVEAWPLSSRSKNSVEYLINKDGPLPCLITDGVPVVQINEVIGYRPGGIDLVLISCKGLGGSDFFLSLDETQVEALMEGLAYVKKDFYEH